MKGLKGETLKNKIFDVMVLFIVFSCSFAHTFSFVSDTYQRQHIHANTCFCLDNIIRTASAHFVIQITEYPLHISHVRFTLLARYMIVSSSQRMWTLRRLDNRLFLVVFRV